MGYTVIMDKNESHYKSLQEQLNVQQEALVKIYQSVEKTRKIMFWTGVANLVVFVVPLIFVAIVLPRIIGTFTSSLDGLGIGQVSEISQNISEPSLRDSLENLQNLGF